MTYTYHYHSPLGGITVSSNGSEITGLWFDGQKYFGDTLHKEYKEKNLPIFEETKKWLNIYFSGKAPNFTPPLKMETTSFRKTVWKIMLTISFGQTMTYGEIANIIAKQKGLTGYSGGIEKKCNCSLWKKMICPHFLCQRKEPHYKNFETDKVKNLFFIYAL